MSTKIDEWLGQKLKGRNGTYLVRSFLGGGGMASVYLAEDTQGREVAVKIPREAILAEEGFGARFVREVRLLTKFNHPHVLKVYDVSADDEAPFVVMQYLALGSLRLQQPTVEKSGDYFPMRPDEVTQWLGDIADALDYVHHNGFVHRDVKPENIMFDADGNAYLGDFGIIKVRSDGRKDTPETIATGAGMVLGTPYYMAPEILLTQPYDGRADQYSLAVTVYELLTAHVPFAGEAPVVFVGHMTKQPPSLTTFISGFPKALEDVVLKGMAKKPSDRYRTCRAFADAFDAATKACMPRKATASKSEIVLPAVTPKPAPATRTPPPIPAPPSSANLPSRSGTGITCPHCGDTARLPQGVRSRTLRCAKCRKVFSTDDTKPRPTHSAATSHQEQAKIETRADTRRRPRMDDQRPDGKSDRRGSPSRRQAGNGTKILLIVSFALFGFFCVLGGLTAALGVTTLAAVAFGFAFLALLVGIIAAVLVVLRKSNHPEVARLCRECEQALVERRYADVLRLADQALALDPECARAFMQRGFAHAKRKEYQNALRDLDRAIALDDTLADAYAARAHVYRSIGDEQRARADERKANELNRQ